MRHLELTCELCGREEKIVLTVRGRPQEAPKNWRYPADGTNGWQTVPIKGEDVDVCPVCWNEIVAAVKARLP